jgi:glycosyltransferase involved in cell wall biosynthesis
MIVPHAGPLEQDCRGIGPLTILDEILPRGRIWQRAYRRVQWRHWVRDLHRWAPHLIYINSVASLPIARTVPLPEVPAIVHVRELHSELFRILKECPDLLTRMPMRYIAVSDVVRRALVTECGIARDRIEVINVFIPEWRLDAVPRPPIRRPDNGTVVVGGCGIPGWRKGTTLWLQMAAEVRRLVGPSALFVWVGVPEWPDPNWHEGVKFRREVSLLGLDGTVELISLTDKAFEHFARFDIFAMTSWEDPCPRVVLENMGLGTPVVCFAGGGGAREVLGDTGVVVTDFDPGAMARAIAGLAASPQERARLGALAKRRMRANFTDRAQVPKIRREINLLLDRQPYAPVHTLGAKPLEIAGTIAP